MPLLKVTFSETQLAGIDGLRRGQPRASWVRDRVQDVLVASQALEQATTLAADLPYSEDGALGPHPTDPQVAAATGHPFQPCRCPACTTERERLRGSDVSGG